MPKWPDSNNAGTPVDGTVVPKLVAVTMSSVSIDTVVKRLKNIFEYRIYTSYSASTALQ
jgi:hypothetical protein